MMIDEERMVTFITSLDKGLSPFLAGLEKEAKLSEVPIIRKEMQGLLKFLVVMNKPEEILEVGTATGFSALLMWEASGKTAKITTIEKYEKRIPIAKENFEKAGAGQDITLLEGDAEEILKQLALEKKKYPVIFMDAAKGQYLNFLPMATELLAPGGLLISDNILQEGDVCESRYAVTRRNRTIHSRMREYLYELKNNGKFETVILNIGDGVALSYLL